jgi:hypothetical protein
LSEDGFQVYEAWSMGCDVEIATPGGLAPFLWTAVTRVAAASGVLASDDEIDVAEIGRVLAAA